MKSSFLWLLQLCHRHSPCILVQLHGLLEETGKRHSRHSISFCKIYEILIGYGFRCRLLVVDYYWCVCLLNCLAVIVLVNSWEFSVSTVSLHGTNIFKPRQSLHMFDHSKIQDVPGQQRTLSLKLSFCGVWETIHKQTATSFNHSLPYVDRWISSKILTRPASVQVELDCNCGAPVGDGDGRSPADSRVWLVSSLRLRFWK